MTWLETCTKRRWEIDSPETYPYSASEIAHSLSRLCRYAGHTPHLYSVAQHSMAVATAVVETSVGNDPWLVLAALLHDASEAYLVDIPAPIKRLPGMQAYRDLERRTHRAILASFMPAAQVDRCIDHAEIARADLAVLHREKLSILRSDLEWGPLPDPAPLSVWTTWQEIDREIVERSFRESIQNWIAACDLGKAGGL